LNELAKVGRWNVEEGEEGGYEGGGRDGPGAVGGDVRAEDRDFGGIIVEEGGCAVYD
jgi:hypothetical protein